MTRSLVSMSKAPDRCGAVVVVGASGAIGHASALELASRGLHVLGTYRRPGGAALLRRDGVDPVRMDLAEPASIQQAVSALHRALQGATLHGLVHAAGMGAVGPIEHTDPSWLAEMLAVNVVGPLAVCQGLLPELRASAGRIVLVSSQSGRIVLPFLGAYSTSKFALEALSDALRRELAAEGVRVAVVQPGVVRIVPRHPAREVALDAVASPRLRDAYERFLATRRASARRGAVDPAHVARAVAEAVVSSHAPERRGLLARGAWRDRLLPRLPVAWQDTLLARRLR